MKYQKAIKRVIKELRKDKSQDSMYYSWQSNIACPIMDIAKVDHDKANEAARSFLELLIK